MGLSRKKFILKKVHGVEHSLSRSVTKKDHCTDHLFNFLTPSCTGNSTHRCFCSLSHGQETLVKFKDIIFPATVVHESVTYRAEIIRGACKSSYKADIYDSLVIPPPSPADLWIHAEPLFQKPLAQDSGAIHFQKEDT